MDRALKRSARDLAFAGMAAIVFGVIALIWPGISLVALTALVSAFALVYGLWRWPAALTWLRTRASVASSVWPSASSRSSDRASLPWRWSTSSRSGRS